VARVAILLDECIDYRRFAHSRFTPNQSNLASALARTCQKLSEGGEDDVSLEKYHDVIILLGI
jgi:hypothetical protein